MENIAANIGVFVDSDNISPNYFVYIYNEIKSMGRIISLNVYADWTKEDKKTWKDVCYEYGLKKIQCDRLTKIKDSSDIKMMCDMVHYLYTVNSIQIYILVTSDSDFFHVASLVKQEGNLVYCFGYEKTPQCLKNICDRFISIECLRDEDESIEEEEMNTQKSFDFTPMIHTPQGNSPAGLSSTIVIKPSSSQYNSGLRRFLDSSDEKNPYGTGSSPNEQHTVEYENVEEYKKEIIKAVFNENKYYVSLSKFTQKLQKKNLMRPDIDKWIQLNMPSLKILNRNGNQNVYYVEIKNKIDDVFEQLNTNTLPVSILKIKLLQIDNSFDQRKWGFSKFVDFLEVLFSNNYSIDNSNMNSSFIINSPKN